MGHFFPFKLNVKLSWLCICVLIFCVNMYNYILVCVSVSYLPCLCFYIKNVSQFRLPWWLSWRRQWQPTPVLLPGESQGWRSLVGCRLWGHTESDTTEATWRRRRRFSIKESTCQCRRCRFDVWVGKIPWRRECQPTPVVLPGKSHGQRSLAGYSQQGRRRVRCDLAD